ncbi:MAG: Xaa-Pro peptidase family protein [Syntrophotaleaceae bacterium]
MVQRVPLSELTSRMSRFRQRMDRAAPEWEVTVLFGRINQYYFSGTMQDGVLLIPRDRESVYFVRRDMERARDESLLPGIEPMSSFRDVAERLGCPPQKIHIETEIVPLAHLQRFRKYFPASEIMPADPHVAAVRAVKSSYELARIEQAGQIHRHVLENLVPELLREGMSEADLASKVYPVLVAEGHQGVARFSMFQSDMGMGLFCFGESSLYPTSFDGPGGGYGMYPAVPTIGSHRRKLTKGDLVFVDFACGVEGYHTDKTMTYVFGAAPGADMKAVHEQCVAIQNRVAEMLVPGAVPAQVYQTVMDRLSPEFLQNFMGFGSRQSRFLGHGIGLQVDEQPVIAKGFDEPLQEGMVFAVEPKKGIAGVGMVGTENTFVVTAEGGRCLTGDHPGLMTVC